MKSPLRALALLAILLTLLASAAPALADKRVALLIGNGAYAAVPALANPRHDVALLKTALEKAGFDDVRVAYDLGQKPMLKALNAFADEAADADIAVIYYSGHGMEMDGVNYLVPVDAKFATTADVGDEAVTLERALEALEGAKRLKLVILDACRTNPFLASMKAKGAHKGIERGLAPVEPAGSDTLVAFAAKAGTPAYDGDGDNSPFAAALARRLFTPGDDVEIALRKVRDDVLAATGNRQEPFKYGSLGGAVIPLSKAPASAPSNEGERQAAYDAAIGAGSVAGLDAFLSRYPDGGLAQSARRERERLAKLAPPTPAPETRQPRVDLCSKASEDAILAPVRDLFTAMEALDLERYAAQWADDGVYVDRRTGRTRDKAAVVAEKRGGFARWTGVTVKLNGPRIVSRAERTAVLDDRYELYLVGRGRLLPPERGHEAYTVRCDAEGRWLIVRNDDYLP